MKNEFIYFTIEEPNKEIYACKYRRTAQTWVSNLMLAVKFSAELEKNPHMISEIKRNEHIIEDVEVDSSPKKPKKSRRDLFAGSLYSRHSTVSNKSAETNPNNSKNTRVASEEQNFQKRSTDRNGDREINGHDDSQGEID